MSMSHNARADARRHPPLRRPGRGTAVRRRVIVAVAALAALPVLGACEGDNLFAGDSPVLEPRVLEVASPPAALTGDTIGVRVTASAPREVVQLNFSVRGAFFRDTVITIASPASHVTRLVSVALPATLQDSLVIVEASAVDRAGALSRIRADTILVVGLPAVLQVDVPDSVRLGTAFTFTVHARGGRPISDLLVSASGAFNESRTIGVVPAVRTLTQDVTLQAPGAVQDTVLRLAVAARDESGLTGPAFEVVIPVSIPGPTLSMAAPPTAQPGGRADLDISASAMRGVASLRFELRGAITRDTVVEVSPAATSVQRSVSIPIPGSVTGSELRVRAFAVDAGGAVSAPVADTIAISSGDPVIESVSVLTAAPRSGQTVDVRVVASSVRPLTRVDVTFRRAAEADLEFPIVPARTSATVDASVSVAPENTDTLLIVRATATDEAGIVSAVSETLVKIEVPVDTTTLSMAAFPAAFSAAPMSLQVRSAPPVPVHPPHPGTAPRLAARPTLRAW